MRKSLLVLVALALAFTPWKGEASAKAYTVSQAQDRAVAYSRNLSMAEDREDQAYFAWKLAVQAAELVPPEAVSDYDTATLKYLRPFEAMTTYTLARQAVKAAREAERYQAKSAYYALLKARGLEAVAKEGVKLGEEGVRLVREFHAAGVTPWLDVLQAQANLADMEAALSSAKLAVAVARLTFNSLVGDSLDRDPELAEEIEFVPLGDIDVQHYVRRAQDRRFEVHQAEATLELREYDLEIANNYGPSNLVKIKEAAVSEAKTNLAQKKSEVKLQVLKAYQAVLDAESKVLLYAKGVSAAEEAARVAWLRFQQGLTTSVEAMGAETALLTAKNRHLDAIYQHILAREAFYYSASEGMLSPGTPAQGGGTH